MANRKFTEQEMLTLRNSKYVLDVHRALYISQQNLKNCFGGTVKGQAST